MADQTFVDESKVQGFLLAAASIPCSEVDRLRTGVGALHLKHQDRIHFRREQTGRQKKVLGTLTSLGSISTVIYDARRFDDQKAGRNAAIARMADDAASMQVARIVIESDDSAADQDKAIITRRLKQAHLAEVVTVVHCRPSAERLLAIPDAVAWCYVKGGTWQAAVMPLIKEVVVLLAPVKREARPTYRPIGCRARLHTAGAECKSILYCSVSICQLATMLQLVNGGTNVLVRAPSHLTDSAPSTLKASQFHTGRAASSWSSSTD